MRTWSTPEIFSGEQPAVVAMTRMHAIGSHVRTQSVLSLPCSTPSTQPLLPPTLPLLADTRSSCRLFRLLCWSFGGFETTRLRRRMVSKRPMSSENVKLKSNGRVRLAFARRLYSCC